MADVRNARRHDTRRYIIKRPSDKQTKAVYRVSDKASFKPVSSATETRQKIESSPIARLGNDIFQTNKKGITMALIRLRGYEDRLSHAEAQL